MLTLDNIIYFDNDNEFYDYCVKPTVVVNSNALGSLGYDIEFTDHYNNAIANNQRFCIKDENSKIFKHNCVNYKLISKDIQNLEPYFAGFTDKVIDKKLQLIQENGNN